LSESSENSEKANKCNELARSFIYKDLDQVEYYANLAVLHAKSCDSLLEEAKAYLSLGAMSFLRQNFETGIKYYSKALTKCGHDPLTLVRVYMGIGVCYSQLTCYKEAITYEEKALKIACQENLLPEKAAIFNNIGRIYHEIGDFQLAFQYYSRGFNIAEEQNITKTQGYLLVGLIRNEIKAKAFMNAEKFLLKLEKLIEKHNEMWYMGISRCLWATYYMGNDAKEIAKDYFAMGIEIIEDENQEYYLGFAYKDYAEALTESGDYYAAKLIYEKYHDALVKHSIHAAFPQYHCSISKYYSKQSRVKQFNIHKNLFDETKDSLSKTLKEYFPI
jgi:tetratricopeptide (TPR) repeat protein